MTETPASSALQPIRIAVIGMGGIGSAFAFQLAQQGHHDVTAIARPGSTRLQQLQRDGGVIDIKGELAALSVTDTLDEIIPYDLILVTLPAHRVTPLLPVLRRSAARWIQFMFNTFEPEQHRDAGGGERCSFGMPFLQASLDTSGKLNDKIGAGGQKTRMDDERWASLFQASGLPAVFEPGMLLWLRCHVPRCVAFESVAVAGKRRGSGALWNKAITIARGLQEGLKLVQQIGFELYPTAKARMRTAPILVPASMLWFVSRIPSFRELLATGADECRALVDVIVKEANGTGRSLTVSRIEAMKPVGV